MKLYMAPMEGFTTYPYRNVHKKYFSGVDKYFTPFLSTNRELTFNPHDRKEIEPANNPEFQPGDGSLVPQILTKDPDQLIWACGQLQELGYTEINLNLGCPSATVVSKGKGAGMLRNPDDLREFMDGVFPTIERTGMKLSVKTRLGMADPGEFEELVRIYNDYPVSELIVHARVREDFYKEPVRKETFAKYAQEIKAPLVLNGDIRTKEDIKRIVNRFPDMKGIMIGRGLMTNPALGEEDIASEGRKLTAERYQAFLTDLYFAYREAYGSIGNALIKMKALWEYTKDAFEENRKGLKAIRKARQEEEYLQAVKDFFSGTKLML